MAQYYNVVTNANGTFTFEEVQRICPVEGQQVQLVEDINNGSSQQFLGHTAAPQNNEQTIFCPQTINLGSQITTTQLEQGQSLYIIKTNEASTTQNILKSNTVKVHRGSENIINVDSGVTKTSLEHNNKEQQIQWIKMRDNSTNVDTVSKQNTLVPEKNQTAVLSKNQGQNNITLPLTVQGSTEALPYNSGSAERKPPKIYPSKGRFSKSGGVHTGLLPTSSDDLNLVSQIGTRTPNSNASADRRIISSSHNKTVSPLGQNVTATAARQVRGSFLQIPQTPPTVPTQMSKNLLKQQRPEMEHLSERIKQEKLRQMQNQRQIQNDQRVQHTTQRHQVSQGIHNSASNSIQQAAVVQQSQQQNAAMQMQQLQKQSAQSPLSQSSRSTQNNLDTSSDTSPEKGLSSPNQTDSDSQSVAYLQKTIDNPANTIVQRQIQGNTAKMLVMMSSREQRLITFDIPAEDCTVQDLLEQANLPLTSEIVVSLVSDSTLGINYIVEPSSGILNEISEHNNSNTSPDVGFRSTPRSISSPDENSNPMSQNEEPMYVEGKLALCPNCGISSLDFNRCQRCLKKLPEDVKTIPMTMGIQEKKENVLHVNTFYEKSNERNSSAKLEKLERDGSAYKRGKVRGKSSISKTKNINKEPVCLTISSDEDEESKIRKADNANSNSLLSNSSNNSNEEMETILEKEPVITNDSVSNKTINYSADNEEDSSMQNAHTTLSCRTVRIGSYKYVPREKVVISQSGLRLGVPLLEDEKSFVSLEIKMQDIVRVLIHFGKSMPVLFFYTCTSTGAQIRELLGMQDPKGPYYDPAGKDHTHKRITVLPEKLSEESKQVLKNIFMPKNLLEELNSKEANDILVRASPKHNLQVQSATRKQNQATTSNNTSMNGGVQRITVYPPPPAKGGIAINIEDYLCLAEDQFLNDVIIDFYLKYLTLEILSETDQHRTHVFSSYFYKRLTSPHTPTVESTVPLSPATKRHARVQKWTKNVNIFEKDFVIIPINEHAHWFLAIICFPGLVGKVSVNLHKTKEDDLHRTPQKSKKLKTVQAVTIGSTTITPVTTTITIDQGDDGSERDEAEGDDEEMEMESDEDDEIEGHEETKSQEMECSRSKHEETVKVPCILIFDSLAGASRSRVVATLRDYLSCEHVAKMGVEKTFSKDTIKGACPKVPQQSNFTDCGLYVLQYVESFFKNPIKDYTLPIKTLKNWFEEIVVTRKREELSKLLVKLMNDTKGDKNVTLPVLNFPTQDGKLKPKVENHIDVKVKSELENKRKSADGESRMTNNIPIQTETTESIVNDVVNRTTTYQIIPISSCTSSSSPESTTTSSELLTDVKSQTRSSSETMSYLKSKRIPRLMLRTDAQDDSQTAKKHKGDFFDSCK